MKSRRDFPFCVRIRRKAPKIRRKPLLKVGISHGSAGISAQLAEKTPGLPLIPRFFVAPRDITVNENSRALQILGD